MSVRATCSLAIALFTSLMFSPMLSAGSDYDPDEELIRNGSFEEIENGLPIGWQKNPGKSTVMDIDTSLSDSGRVSVFISTPAGHEDLSVWPAWSQSMVLPEGIDVLRLTAKIRTDGAHQAYAALNYYDSSGERITWQQSRSIEGTHDWCEVSLYGDVPPETNRISVDLHLYGDGRAWFDSVSMIGWHSGDEPGREITLSIGNMVNDDITGFGFQLNPFLFMRVLNNADEARVRERIDYLDPEIVRVFVDTRWWDPRGTGAGPTDWEGPDMRALYSVLDVSTDTSVNIVMWRPNDWNEGNVAKMVRSMGGLLAHLKDRGYDNIEYLTLYNEPDLECGLGADGYIRMYDMMAEELEVRGLDTRLVCGDVATGTPGDFADCPGVSDFSYHEYINFFQGGLAGTFYRMDSCLEEASGGQLVVWETNVRGKDAGTCSPGTGVSSPNVLDEVPPAIMLAQFVTGGLSRGISGMCYWDFCDMRYPGCMMEYGLMDSRLEPRPAFYVYSTFTRLIERGADVYRIDGDLGDIAAALVDNPDGSRYLFIVNPYEEAKVMNAGSVFGTGSIRILNESDLNPPEKRISSVFEVPGESFAAVVIRS